MTEVKLINNINDKTTNIEVIEIEGYKIHTYEVDYLERIKGLYGFIYVTTNLINGKMYVGQRKIREGWRTYRGSGHALRKAIKKYGYQNFDRKIIDIAFNQDELNSLEYYYVKVFGAMNKRYWYNICEGGRCGAAKLYEKEVSLYDVHGVLINKYKSLTIATKESGDSRDVIRNNCNGKTKVTQKGHVWRWGDEPFNKYNIEYNDNPKCRSVDSYDLSGNFIKTYYGEKEAERQTGVSHSSITDCCNGKKSSANDIVWRWQGEPFDKFPVINHIERIKMMHIEKYGISVKQFDLKGNLLNIYNGLHEAERITGVNRANITKCCKGEAVTAGEYIWRYLNDNFGKYNTNVQKMEKVYCFDLDWNLLCVYKTVSKASRETGIDRSTISRHCINKKPYKNMYLRYKSDVNIEEKEGA